MYRSVLDNILSLERNWNNFFNEYDYNRRNTTYPVINAYESGNELKLIAALPGLKQENIDLKFEKGVLTISGKKENGVSNDAKYIREEISYGNFSKSITLGNDINVDSIVASYKDGLLYITCQKKEEAQPKKIEVK